MPEQLQSFFFDLDFVTILEIVAVITALIYVYFAAKEKVLCFLFGFISSAIYIYICFSYRLYFDTLISIYYTVMSVVGWILWDRNNKKGALEISFIGRKKFFRLCLLGFAIVLVTATLAKMYTDASLAYIDSFTTVFAVIATFMLVKKQIENWLLFIVVDFVSIGIYLHKNLYFTSFLYALYTAIAIRGYIEWKKAASSKTKSD